MTWKTFFGGCIRIVFLFAFGAFLMASIHHIATFFHNFEPTNVDWTGSYALAISVDGTALMLTIGMMFFGKDMPVLARIIVWLFIIALTAFSWIVNWEYAITFQSNQLKGLDPAWREINPILASSFAFLNLAYSIVSEFFNARVKSMDELHAELADLTGERAQILRQIREAKATEPGLIQRAKNAAMEIKNAAAEVLEKPEGNAPEFEPESAPNSEQNEEVNEPEFLSEIEEDPGQKSKAQTDELLFDNFGEDAVKIPLEDTHGGEPITDPESPSATERPVLHAPEKHDIHIDRGIPDMNVHEEPVKYSYREMLHRASDTPFNWDTVTKRTELAPERAPEMQSKTNAQNEKSARELSGLLPRDAAKENCCKNKGITTREIQAAIKAGKLKTFRDGSVAKSALQSWAKTFKKSAA